MKNLKTVFYISLLSILSLTFSCSKNEVKSPSPANKNVYLFGEEFVYGYSIDQNPIKAMFWKNGESTILPEGTNTVASCASGNDIYVISREGKCWKNGVRKLLPASQDGSTIFDANSISVINDDIYMTGRSIDGNQIIKPTFWKNGQPTNFNLPSANAQIINLTLVNNSFYVLGYVTEIIPNPYGGLQSVQKYKYWKNGIENIISDESLINPNFYSISANKIFVSSTNDIYILGYNSGILKCYKNGISIGDFINARSFNAIDVVNNDVYIVGSKFNFTENKTLPAYWKNGEATYITDGIVGATLNSIKVVGNDIYIGGFGLNNEGIVTAKFWKNGVANQVKDLVTKTKSNTILITD